MSAHRFPRQTLPLKKETRLSPLPYNIPGLRSPAAAPHKQSTARPASADILFAANTAPPENSASSRRLPAGIPHPVRPGSPPPYSPIGKPVYLHTGPGLPHTMESITSVQSPIGRSSDDSIYRFLPEPSPASYRSDTENPLPEPYTASLPSCFSLSAVSLALYADTFQIISKTFLVNFAEFWHIKNFFWNSPDYMI